jgi:NADH-quinone oxidoreductase subunit H
MEAFLSTTPGLMLIIAAQSLLVIGFVMISLLFLVYGDRKIWAAVQMRRGPNMVGAFGLLQTVADALKYVVKEVVIPAGADRPVFMLAPLTSFVLAMIAWAVIPFNDTWVLADINVAILYVFAISSLEVYGVIMGGWASNSKYPFLGSLRSAAQMISYEVSIGLIIIGVIISTGSLNFGAIVNAQDTGYGIFGWYWLPHLPMVVLFFISALAETNRPPFDLPEAESELVAGYQVEYSSTPFLLFMAGEYIAIFLMCALMTLLFFGGWLSPIPGLPDGALWMVGKMALFFFLFAMVKAVVPRYRYDQLMRIGWKVFLPFVAGLGRVRGLHGEVRGVRRVLRALGVGGMMDGHRSRHLSTARRAGVAVFPGRTVGHAGAAGVQPSRRDEAKRCTGRTTLRPGPVRAFAGAERRGSGAGRLLCRNDVQRTGLCRDRNDRHLGLRGCDAYLGYEPTGAAGLARSVFLHLRRRHAGARLQPAAGVCQRPEHAARRWAVRGRQPVQRVPQPRHVPVFGGTGLDLLDARLRLSGACLPGHRHARDLCARPAGPHRRGHAPEIADRACVHGSYTHASAAVVVRGREAGGRGPSCGHPTKRLRHDMVPVVFEGRAMTLSLTETEVMT